MQHFSGTCNLFGGSWKPNPGKQGLVQCSDSLPPNTWAGMALGHAHPPSPELSITWNGMWDAVIHTRGGKKVFTEGKSEPRTCYHDGDGWTGSSGGRVNPLAGSGGEMTAVVAVLALLGPLLCGAAELEMVDGARELTCSEVISGLLAVVWWSEIGFI